MIAILIPKGLQDHVALLEGGVPIEEVVRVLLDSIDFGTGSAGPFVREVLGVNSDRVRHRAENNRGFNYQHGPGTHSDDACEIELVIAKIARPSWDLA